MEFERIFAITNELRNYYEILIDPDRSRRFYFSVFQTIRCAQ